MWKRILAIASILGLLLVAYYLLRPYYRLPFDRMDVFDAVPQNAAAILHLPTLSPDGLSDDDARLWHLDAKKVATRLANIGLGESVVWESWWLIPVQGDGPLSATYTFVGVAKSGLASAPKYQLDRLNTCKSAQIDRTRWNNNLLEKIWKGGILRLLHPLIPSVMLRTSCADSAQSQH